eukprot:2596748-Prymnesium_polylepis.1
MHGRQATAPLAIPCTRPTGYSPTGYPTHEQQSTVSEQPSELMNAASSHPLPPSLPVAVRGDGGGHRSACRIGVVR